MLLVAYPRVKTSLLVYNFILFCSFILVYPTGDLFLYFLFKLLSVKSSTDKISYIKPV